MSKVLCFGEVLLRLSPVLGGEWIRQSSMPVFIGGAELNTASALGRWGVPVAYLTAVPDHYLSAEVVAHIASRNIDVSKIQYCGNRIGTYYLPQGADMKHSGVIYDRACSSFAELKPGQIDWKEMLQDVAWFHFSAINPALSAHAAAVCKEALQVASDLHITISVDLNYRAKLWQYGKKPTDVMPELFAHCDVVMGNIWAAEDLLGIGSPIPESKGRTKEDLIEAAGMSMKQMHARYPKVQTIAYTFRLEKNYFGLLQHGSEMVTSRAYELNDIVDKVGSGDTFMAGLIYGNQRSMQPQEIIDFATAAAYSKLFIKGDATNASVEEIRKGYLDYA